MKKLVLPALVAAGMFFAGNANAQLIDEKNVTVTMDLQPILQLDMTTPSQIEFTFDDIQDYYAGITQYAATILKVSSTVSWDLYAVGRSNGTNGPEFWDQVITYNGGGATGAIDDLPLSLIELRQSQPNSGDGAATGAFSDYSTAFRAVGSEDGANSLYVNAGTNTPPTLDDKYIAGHSGTTGVAGDDFMSGGSYLTSTGTTSDYYYAIDYRILPGLPAIFPNAYDADAATAEDLVTANGAGSYAQPGVYTMYVQYILLEDQ